MSDVTSATAWSLGYVSDVPYTLGFHRELAPSFLNYVCLISGVEGLPPRHRLRYCELGCGSGYGTALLAASNPDVDFVGIDFNPLHIAEARSLAERSRLSNIDFVEIDFGTAVRSSDPQLGAFDFVAMHGVYAWVTPEVREDIHEFLRVKLAPGGTAFVSYNAMPGYARIVPTQRLLFESAQRATGDSLERAAAGMRLLRLLIEKSDGMVARHGALSEKYVTHLAGRDPRYLAHEFLAAGWKPFFVTEMMSAMADAGLSYVGSAAIADNRIELCVPRELRETVRTVPDIGMRELLKDYIVGKQFRRDVYVRQPRPLDSSHLRKLLMEQAFAPMPHVRTLPETMRVPAGDLRPKKDVLDAIWECFDGRLATGAEFLGAAVRVGEMEARVWALIDILVHNGLIHPACASAGIESAPSDRLNRTILELSVSQNTHGYLAAPALGSAIATNLPERVLSALLVEQPELNDTKTAEKAFDRVNGSNQQFMRDGRPVENTEENVQALAGFVREFREHRLPRWRLLGVVD